MAVAEDKINNYTLGRGELYFAPFKPGTKIPGGERYLGNSPSVSYNASEETLKHYSSDRGVGQLDASVTLSQDYAGALELDNIEMANIAMFFLGDAVELTVATRTVTDEPLQGVEPGLSYQLGTSDAEPTGARMVSAVTLANVTTPANVPVAGVDYVIDPKRGRVTILEGSTKILKGDNLTADYTVDPSTRSQVASKGKTIEGQLRYVANNPAGAQIDYLMPHAKLTPNGDFNLKGDDWQVLPFNLEMLKKGSLSAIYADGQAYTPTP